MTQKIFAGALVILLSAGSTPLFATGDPLKNKKELTYAEKINLSNREDFFLHLSSFMRADKPFLMTKIEQLENLLKFCSASEKNLEEASKSHKFFSVSTHVAYEFFSGLVQKRYLDLQALMQNQKLWESLKEKGIQIQFFIQDEGEGKIWNFVNKTGIPPEDVVPSFSSHLDIRHIRSSYQTIEGKKTLCYSLPASERKIQKLFKMPFPVQQISFSNLEVNNLIVQFVRYLAKELRHLKFYDCFLNNPMIIGKGFSKLQSLELGFPKNKYLHSIPSIVSEDLLRQLKELKINAYDHFSEDLDSAVLLEIGDKPVADNKTEEQEVSMMEKEVSSTENKDSDLQKEDIPQKKPEFALEKLSLSMPESAYLINVRLFLLKHLTSLTIEPFDRLGAASLSTKNNNEKELFIKENLDNTKLPVWHAFVHASFPSLRKLSLKEGIVFQNLGDLGKIFDLQKLEKLIFYGDREKSSLHEKHNAVDLSAFPNLKTFGCKVDRNRGEYSSEYRQKLTHPLLEKWVILNGHQLFSVEGRYDFPQLKVIRVKVPRLQDYKGCYYQTPGGEGWEEIHYPEWHVDNRMIRDLLDHQKNAQITLMIDRGDDALDGFVEKYTQMYQDRELTIEVLDRKVRIVSKLHQSASMMKE